MTMYYSEEHEWIEVNGDTAMIGITQHAADQLGEIVFVELKEAEDEFEKGDEIGVIESVKAASEIYAPVDGAVVEANESLADNPGALNESPEGDAWIYKIKLADAAQLEDLMDLDAYKAFIDLAFILPDLRPPAVPGLAAGHDPLGEPPNGLQTDRLRSL